MPDLQDAPKAIDWENVKSLYFHGVTPTEIAKQTGVRLNTISVMASRKGWPAMLRKAKETSKAVQISVEQPEAESPKLTAQSEAVRAALARDIQRVCELIDAQPAPTLSKALARQQAMEPVVRNSKAVFGWSDSNTSPAVRISVLDSVVVMPVSAHSPEKPVIECEPAKAIGQEPDRNTLPPLS